MNNIILPLIFAILSLVSVPLNINIFNLIKTRIQNKKGKRTRVKEIKDEMKVPLKQKLKTSERFILKESPLKSKALTIKIAIFVIIFAISFANKVTGFLFALILPIFYYWFCVKNSKQILEERNVMIENMLTFKKSRMGLNNSKSDVNNYQEEFEILQWDEALIAPQKIRLYVPITFDELNKEMFMENWSAAFGVGAAWAIDVEDEEFPGWNTPKGYATIKQVEPLPQMAAWSEHYVINDKVAWSWFPLGIGVNNGILLENPQTGQMEHVIGIDVNGDQLKLAKKIGQIVGPEVVRSPQTLVCGATGGGKALCLEEMVSVIQED